MIYTPVPVVFDVDVDGAMSQASTIFAAFSAIVVAVIGINLGLRLLRAVIGLF